MTFFFASCSQELNEPTTSDSEMLKTDEFDATKELSDFEITQIVEQKNEIEVRSNGTTYYDLDPTRGCPGETSYLFVVKDSYIEPPIAVKLYSPEGNTYYVPLLRANIYQYRIIRLMTQGRWYWRYVFTINKLPCEPGVGSYIKDNTIVTYDDDDFIVAWPFDSEQCWIQTCGNGCGAHTTQNGEYYAQDWACTTGTLNERFLSPLDGVVSKVGWAPTTYGNYIEVEQEIGDKRIRFRVAHLESTNVYVNQVVTAGETVLGLIGSTGNSTGAHAHCSLFEVPLQGAAINRDFEFEQFCEEE